MSNTILFGSFGPPNEFERSFSITCTNTKFVVKQQQYQHTTTNNQQLNFHSPSHQFSSSPTRTRCRAMQRCFHTAIRPGAVTIAAVARHLYIRTNRRAPWAFLFFLKKKGGTNPPQQKLINTVLRMRGFGIFFFWEF